MIRCALSTCCFWSTVTWFQTYQGGQKLSVHSLNPATVTFESFLEYEYLPRFLEWGALLQTVEIFYTYLPAHIVRGVNKITWNNNTFLRSKGQYLVYFHSNLCVHARTRKSNNKYQMIAHSFSPLAIAEVLDFNF